jgi:two-component system phosphate regulon response regulator PhoB
MPETILLVDDESELLQALLFALRREGYEARTARNGRDALAIAMAEPAPDLVLLDLMLPDMPGTEVCKRLKAAPATAGIPIIMVTARNEEIDRVVGFEVGADDYVAKPFSNRELILRIRAVLRRNRPREDAGPAEAFGRLKVDAAGHRAWVDGQEVALTALEFKLLGTFMARRGRVQDRETLLDQVWGLGTAVTTRTVDTHVKRLRQKLGPAGDYIETRRGVGYRFRDRPDDPPSE